MRTHSTAKQSFIIASGIMTICMLLLVAMVYQRFSYSGQAQAANVSATLVKTTQTSAWSPPSPDPSGIAFWRGHLVISDGEVDEMSIYAGANIFEAGTNGNLTRKSTTVSYSKEPTGVAVGANNHIFFSDDVKRMVFEIDPGSDGQINTSDDRRTSFSTRSFGSNDPEGLAYGGGTLFISDGAGSEVYSVNPGANGKFDGSGDDRISHFDTGKLGESDPEGIEYSGNSLFVVGHGNKKQMLEISTSGTLIRTINISALGAKKPSGLASGPGSRGGRSFYIVDRGVDNNTNPKENDGKLYEISL